MLRASLSGAELRAPAIPAGASSYVYVPELLTVVYSRSKQLPDSGIPTLCCPRAAWSAGTLKYAVYGYAHCEMLLGFGSYKCNGVREMTVANPLGAAP